jgi:phosphate-selective porin OprO/OprP
MKTHPLNTHRTALHATCAMLAFVGVAASNSAYAQSAENNDAKIAILEKELATMQQELHKLQKQSAAPKPAADAAYIPMKAAPAASGVVVSMPGNRPTFCTADKLNCVAITGRLQMDTALYDYKPNTIGNIPGVNGTNPQQAQNGVNARRARIGVLGTFSGDWDYSLIFDMGGAQDNSSTIENAYLTYKGIKNLYVDAGYMSVPYTLDEPTGSFNITFLERASPQVLATSLASGDNRSAFGAHANGDSWWFGSYVTGPVSGFTHTLRPQVGATARGVVLPINNQNGSLLLGADAEFLFDTGQQGGGAAETNNLATLNDRIEVRVDPGTNALLNTGTLTNIRGARIVSGEAAAQIGSFYAQGEYFDYSIQHLSGFGSDLHFAGGYGQASYVLTGEQRKYNPVTGAYNTINPASPVHWGTGGIGAWEIAARYSQVNLNDQTIRGGELRDTSLAVNWYVNTNVRLMFDWIHGRVDKSSLAGVDLGAHYDVFAARTQIYF